MKTAVKTTKKVTVKPVARKITKAVQAIEPSFPEAIPQQIAVSLIDFSPFNYRKFFDQVALASFAETLLQHGIISPLTVRPMPSGRYELVAGERRLRAAALANMPTVPAMVRELTDEQVMEIQLTENLHREDPHPLHESFAVQRMQAAGKSIEEIAARLGKSKSFVYSRIKLAGLIEVMQDIFLANKASIQEASDIAGLAPQTQYEVYEQYCTDWQDEDFEMPAGYQLSRFKYDLARAPFNIKDKKLVPEAGACTACPFNSATLKTLFPEMAKEAVCSSHVCYHNKCSSQLAATFRKAIQEHQPDALLYYSNLSMDIKAVLEAIPEASELPRYDRYDVSVLTAPTMPDKEEFMDNEGMDETDGTELEFDEEGYQQAVQEYQSDLAEFEGMVQDGKVLKGLQITGQGTTPILFNPEPKTGVGSSSATVTAKEVQEAIKAGTLTIELLEGEAERLQAREKRSKELDSEKVQLTLHTRFMEQFNVLQEGQSLTAADLTASRLIVYQSMDYYTQREVKAILFPHASSQEDAETRTFFEVLAGLSDAQFSYLIRMALAAKSESKYPGNEAAQALYKVAEAGGLDVQAIEQEQQDKAIVRQEKMEGRLADLQRRKEKLQKKAA